MAKNAILIYSNNGTVHHCFCTESEATVQMKLAAERLESAQCFICDQDYDQEDMYAISSQLRDRVEAAKVKVRADMKLKLALDKFGVPAVREVRYGIQQAFNEVAGVGA